MIPLHGRQEFYRHLEFQSERVDAFIENITATGFHIYSAGQNPVFIFSRVSLSGGKIEIFRDRRPPFDEERRPKMPARLIATSTTRFYTENVEISDIDIIYSEFPEEADPSEFENSIGMVEFINLKASISNITNLSDSLSIDSIMHIAASAEIFNTGRLSMEIIYNLKDINGGYMARGTLGKMDLEAINPALYPLTGIKVEEGVHHGSEFSFSGNDEKSEGILKMSWSGLLIDLTPDAGNFLSSLTRFAGRTFLYRPSGSPDSNNSAGGEIYFERDTTRFVFHYWWNCYLSGILDNVIRDLAPFP
jgi:hypothetical protein